MKYLGYFSYSSREIADTPIIEIFIQLLKRKHTEYLSALIISFLLKLSSERKRERTKEGEGERKGGRKEGNEGGREEGRGRDGEMMLGILLHAGIFRIWEEGWSATHTALY